MELFRKKGYGSTSVADLLEAGGASSESLHGVFPDKKDLLVAVLDAYRRDIPATLLEPAWRDVTDPIERIFSLLGRYRQLLVETDCCYGCPIGSLTLEIHEPDASVRELLAAYFQAWTQAVFECLLEAGRRLPDDLDRLSLAEFVLTVMEGALMQARTFRDAAYFDRAVRELRNYIEILLYGRPGFSFPVRRALADIGGGQR
jgi:TetR/AcrR family transcriptional repressor of nem operon